MTGLWGVYVDDEATLVGVEECLEPFTVDLCDLVGGAFSCALDLRQVLQVAGLDE